MTSVVDDTVVFSAPNPPERHERMWEAAKLLVDVIMPAGLPDLLWTISTDPAGTLIGSIDTRPGTPPAAVRILLAQYARFLGATPVDATDHYDQSTHRQIFSVEGERHGVRIVIYGTFRVTQSGADA